LIAENVAGLLGGLLLPFPLGVDEIHIIVELAVRRSDA
jgi:hypothetical protein